MEASGMPCRKPPWCDLEGVNLVKLNFALWKISNGIRNWVEACNVLSILKMLNKCYDLSHVWENSSKVERSRNKLASTM